MVTTTNKGLSEPANGSLNWDTPLNANFDIIDAAMGGVTTIDVTSVGTGAVTLTTTQYQKLIIAFTGTLTANVTYQVPALVGGQWIVSNAATGAYTVTLKVATGTGVVIAASSRTTVYSDGTNIYQSSTPTATAGSDKQVIYNSSGSYAGSANLTFDGAAVSVGGSTAITGASCASTTATVTFSNGQTIPVGSVVTITGVTPTGYNGSWVTTGTATLNQVQFTVPSTLGSQTVAGTLSYGNLNLGGNLIGGIASQALAAAGTNNSAVMTPLSTAQAITALTPGNTIVRGTPVATTSGTFIDFTSIPSWVKRITVMCNGVSTSGTSIPQFQIGTSGGIVATGYNGGASGFTSSGTTNANSSGFKFGNSNAATNVYYGSAVITNISGNVWVENHVLNIGSASYWGGGAVALSGVLDRLRITTENGTDTFDAGSINIMYEG
jgi:hypothetical protein